MSANWQVKEFTEEIKGDGAIFHQASLTKSDANYGDLKLGKLVAVGSYNPNAFGLYEMHGNVWEWCEDWHGDYPDGAGTGTYRVLRGGSFSGDVSVARFAFRGNVLPTRRGDSGGFRLARTADSKGSVASPTETKPAPVETIPATGNLLVAPFSEAKEVQKAVAKSLQKEVEDKADLGEGVKLDLVLIPAGKFKMGSSASEKGRDNDETQHEVTLTKPYYLGKYEVTQEQWEAVMGENPSHIKGAKLPVIKVSWNDCQEFIKKLNAKTKGSYRLPTEAEWEYACRAGTTTVYSFGNMVFSIDANFDKSKIFKPVAVGSYKANAFCLYDMHGNVLEWCEDWYGKYPMGSVTDPKSPAMGEQRVLRGGYYGDCAESYARGGLSTDTGGYCNIGFRLVRNP